VVCSILYINVSLSARAVLKDKLVLRDLIYIACKSYEFVDKSVWHFYDLHPLYVQQANSEPIIPS
jgi:hypothetical protein